MNAHWTYLTLVLLGTGSVAQERTVTIPLSADVAVPSGAQICADTVFANNPGYGTLTLSDSAGICTGAIIVPVELLSFSASYMDGDVHLTWRTASETNCAAYEIQRGQRLGVWTLAGIVRGRGTTTQEQSYIFIDRPPTDLRDVSILRYRLRQIDMDGSCQYSPVVEAALDRIPAEVTLDDIYPNPVSDLLTIRFSLPDALPARLTIYSITGQSVSTLMDEGIAGCGLHTLSFRLPALPSGVYMIELAAGGVSVVKQCVLER